MFEAAHYSFDEAVELAQSLGAIKQHDVVTVVDGSKKLFTSRLDMPFHNDDPDVSVLLWWCEREAYEGGATVIIDGYELYRLLSESTRASLRELSCFHRNPCGQSVLSGKEKIQWYYIPWDVKFTAAADRGAIEELNLAIKGIKVLKKNWKRGDVLALDNSRYLHGRSAFGGCSRKIHRFMIVPR
jgi:alpha-ketoglutarate-dependent taurine dioxygenase